MRGKMYSKELRSMVLQWERQIKTRVAYNNALSESQTQRSQSACEWFVRGNGAGMLYMWE